MSVFIKIKQIKTIDFCNYFGYNYTKQFLIKEIYGYTARRRNVFGDYSSD